MTVTTIKVTTELRDRLRAFADQHGETLSEGLKRALDSAEDLQAMETLRQDIRNTPPELKTQYEAERDGWLGARLT